MEQLKSKGYGAKSSFLSSLNKMDFERAAPKDNEVLIDILYCGVCHSEMHQAKNDWHNTVYPCDNIGPKVEMILIQKINEAFEHMQKEEVRFRYVIDMQSLKDEE